MVDATKQEAFDKPWHLYAGEQSSSTFHSGYRDEETAKYARDQANMNAEKLGIQTRYTVVRKPEV